jgi:hypothetical protein
MTPEIIEVTINGTTIIFNAFMKRSPKNCAACKTSVLKEGSVKGKIKRATIPESAKEKSICQWRLHCSGLSFMCVLVA